MQLPTELNILGHHLYGKINNSFSRVHSSEATFSLLISYFLQYNTALRGLLSPIIIPQLSPWCSWPSMKLQHLQAGWASSVFWSPNFLIHSLSIPNAEAKWGLRRVAGVGHMSTLHYNAMHRGKAAESSVFLYFVLELPPQRQRGPHRLEHRLLSQ